MKKIIGAVLSMALVITLCFGIVGCSPKVTDNKQDIEEEQRKEQELLELKTDLKMFLDNLLVTETTKKEDPHIDDYFREIIERGKEEIDAAEDTDAAYAARSYAYQSVTQRGSCYTRLKQFNGIHFGGGYCKITGEYEDIQYGIEMDYYLDGLSGPNSNSGMYWKITSNNEDIEVNCIIAGECHWERAWNSETKESFPISEEEKTDITIKTGCSIQPKIDWHKTIVHLDGTMEEISPEDIYFNFIIKYKGEIIGYTVVDVDEGIVLKTVSFAKEDAKNMTKEKVRGYIEDTKTGINGESRDGIKTVNNTVSVYYDINYSLKYQEGKDQRIKTSDGVTDIIFTVPEDLENVEFIMHTDGAFIANGEEKKRIEITLGDEVIYENKTDKDEYVDAMIKRDGQMIGYALFMYRKDLSAFEFVNCKIFTIPDGEEGYFEYNGFEIDEGFLRSYINAEIRQWREKNA